MEEIAIEEIAKGVKQYVLLGAGLDSFAQRNKSISSQVDIYEIDQPDTLVWKEKRLIENGYQIIDNLHFVPVDFEHSSWWEELVNNAFDVNQPTVVSCTGVTLTLPKTQLRPH